MQACYGIRNIPEGSWLCRTCALGIKPPCILCPKLGGAMKSTRYIKYLLTTWVLGVLYKVKVWNISWVLNFFDLGIDIFKFLLSNFHMLPIQKFDKIWSIR